MRQAVSFQMDEQWSQHQCQQESAHSFFHPHSLLGKKLKQQLKSCNVKKFAANRIKEIVSAFHHNWLSLATFYHNTVGALKSIDFKSVTTGHAAMCKVLFIKLMVGATSFGSNDHQRIIAGRVNCLELGIQFVISVVIVDSANHLFSNCTAPIHCILKAKWDLLFPTLITLLSSCCPWITYYKRSGGLLPIQNWNAPHSDCSPFSLTMHILGAEAWGFGVVK